MAFKMKNPSMAKLTKAAGDNRAAMKMKKEAAAKMKKESAMKKAHADKESMAKLMDKASAMKLKKDSPVKADIGEVTITDKKPESKSLMYNVPVIGGKRYEKVKGGFRAMSGKEFLPDSSVEKAGGVKYKAMTPSGRLTDRGVRTSGRYTTDAQGNMKMVAEREGGAATTMKKESSMKMGHKSATKLKKPSPAKQKMNMVKGPDGKMVPDFAVDGKGANDMKSATKMKSKGAAKKGLKDVRKRLIKEGKIKDPNKKEKPKSPKPGPKPMKGKTHGTGMIFNEKVREQLKKLPKAAVPMKVKKKDSGVKMVKRVDPKVSKLKEMKIQQPKPLPNKGRVTPKPTKQIKVAKMKPMKPVKMPKVTARF
jgi:hypothetical protein